MHIYGIDCRYSMLDFHGRGWFLVDGWTCLFFAPLEPWAKNMALSLIMMSRQTKLFYSNDVETIRSIFLAVCNIPTRAGQDATSSLSAWDLQWHDGLFLKSRTSWRTQSILQRPPPILGITSHLAQQTKCPDLPNRRHLLANIDIFLF